MEEGKENDVTETVTTTEQPTTENPATQSDDSSSGGLKPDDIWTQRDCEALQMLETRYREHKWLQLQAGFYNLTGRMVAAEIIKAKFQE